MNQKKRSKEDNQTKKRTISYSKNVFLPVTNLCRNKCAYCGFRKEPGEESWIMSKEEVLELSKKGEEAGCSEALITLGEKPETYEFMENKLKEWGYLNTTDYLVDLGEEILDLGLLPHINPGIVEEKDRIRLRRISASMGLMLECVTELPVHRESPGKDPNLRLEMIEKAGELKIPFTTGILVGIGESWKDRVNSLVEIRKIQEEYGHIQEVIIQPFVPKKGTPMENKQSPNHIDMINTVSLAKSIMPKMTFQVPPNLVENLIDFLEIGIDDLGGISSVTPDYINPENEWPDIKEIESKLSKTDFELKERLPIYPEFTKKADFMSSKVKELIKSMKNKNGYRKQIHI